MKSLILLTMLLAIPLTGPVAVYTGPGLVCLAGKLYYVSPVLENPVKVVDIDGKPIDCPEED